MSRHYELRITVPFSTPDASGKMAREMEAAVRQGVANYLQVSPNSRFIESEVVEIVHDGQQGFADGK